jgi:hypothetical protein
MHITITYIDKLDKFEIEKYLELIRVEMHTFQNYCDLLLNERGK